MTYALQKLAHDRSFFLNFVLAVIGRGLGHPSAKEKNECFNQKGLYSKEWQLFIPGLNWYQVTSADGKRPCCSFVLYHFTQQKRGKTLCLIAIDKKLNDVGKSEINWLPMWITFLARIINSSLRMLQQVLGSEFTKKLAPRNMAFSLISAS